MKVYLANSTKKNISCVTNQGLHEQHKDGEKENMKLQRTKIYSTGYLKLILYKSPNNLTLVGL